MKKFSNDPIENLAISTLYPHYYGTQFETRTCRSLEKEIIYYVREKNWRWQYKGDFYYWQQSRLLKWTEEGVKEEIIGFLCEHNPKLERKFLRAKSELDLTTKKISAL